MKLEEHGLWRIRQMQVFLEYRSHLRQQQEMKPWMKDWRINLDAKMPGVQLVLLWITYTRLFIECLLGTSHGFSHLIFTTSLDKNTLTKRTLQERKLRQRKTHLIANIYMNANIYVNVYMNFSPFLSGLRAMITSLTGRRIRKADSQDAFRCPKQTHKTRS